MNYLKNNKGYTIMELMVVFGMLGTVAFMIWMLYAIWHFVSKFW